MCHRYTPSSKRNLSSKIFAKSAATYFLPLTKTGISFAKIRGFRVTDYSPRPSGAPSVEHPPTRGTSRCAPGAFSLTAPVFQKLACAKRGLVRTASHYFQASSEPTTSPAPHQPHRPHHTPTRSNRSTNARSHTPTTSPAPETTRQSSQQPRQHHTSTRSNRSTNAKSHAPIKPAAPATPHTYPHQPHHQHRPHQRFLYCDGETPNISLKYFAKYFCVPKPTASETSTTLSPASADKSWAALLSRMVRMNTEGFIP